MMNNIKGLHILKEIMPLCLALFFVRTVFIGYKYLFFLLLIPCVFYSVYVSFKHGVPRPKLKTLIMPILVVSLFFAHISPLSNVLKESVNIVLVAYFIAFSKLYYVGDKCEVFLKWIVRLTMFAGCIAIARFVLSMLGITVPLPIILFEGKGYSLVNDNNFYSLFFVISIILLAVLYANNRITNVEHIVSNIVAAINVMIGISRRAYVLYALLLIVMAVCLFLNKYDFKKTMIYNVAVVSVVCLTVGVLIFLSCGTHISEMRQDTKNRYYKIYSLIDNNMTYNEFDIKLFRRYYERYQPQRSDGNLFYNGDLLHGLDWWGIIAPPDDCVKYNLIGEKGNNAIAVSRERGEGYWQVHYFGRPIIYHKNVTYQLSFAYRIIKGNERPFCVGWWVNEGQGLRVNLPQKIEIVDSVWHRCTVEYKFKSDQFNPHCFLNSLVAGTAMEVKDIRLICDDTTGLPRYVDQLPDSVIHAQYSSDSINYFTAPRTDRWRYALELWQTRYDTKQRIFGQGFRYLEWYGEKFYNNPNRHDFPHNPIISSFLYSGIIGGVVYIAFLIMSLWLYWKRRKELGIFFIMYLCCMFFSMFSGSSHFSFPLFAFLSFVPFVEFKNEVETKGNISQ